MTVTEQNYGTQRPRLGPAAVVRIILPYLRDKFLEQLQTVWFIIAYLILFQLVVLRLPVVYAGMISLGVFVVAVGLMFFMEGLRLGLMPLGETIGAILPRNSKMPVILGFSFLLGIGATFAEPAIAVLRAAGAGVAPDDAPLLYSLLNDYTGRLVGSVGAGVGIAVMLGILRFFFGWSLKWLIVPGVSLLAGLTIYAHFHPLLGDIIGLAWDCGAVTTGPVTVPLVLALGIGVTRIVGGEGTGNAGFGIVTLASLFPILAVLLLSGFQVATGGYYGGAHYPPAFAEAAALRAQEREAGSAASGTAAPAPSTRPGFTHEEFQEYLESGEVPADHAVRYHGGETILEDGRIILRDVEVSIEKTTPRAVILGDTPRWDRELAFLGELRGSLFSAMQAIVPLCIFLYFTLRLVLRERLRQTGEMAVGIAFAVTGFTLFGLGITLGLTPLGSQLGGNVPAAFATIQPWGMDGFEGPLFGRGFSGKIVAIIFGFFLGYGATLAEPALNALGATVEKITVGAFKKKLLMQSVALGVGLGIATGVCKIAYNLPLTWLLLPPYLLLLLLTLISEEDFVNFGWDSAGVTTGPITVPLVLAMGLGIGANVPGVTDGFGVLALASVGPIITVLLVGLIVRRTSRGEVELPAEPAAVAE